MFAGWMTEYLIVEIVEYKAKYISGSVLECSASHLVATK